MVVIRDSIAIQTKKDVVSRARMALNSADLSKRNDYENINIQASRLALALASDYGASLGHGMQTDL